MVSPSTRAEAKLDAVARRANVRSPRLSAAWGAAPKLAAAPLPGVRRACVSSGKVAEAVVILLGSQTKKRQDRDAAIAPEPRARYEKPKARVQSVEGRARDSGPH